MNSAQITPTLACSRRDDNGRLTGLIFDSTPPLASPDRNPWLIAVDSSDNALRAVGHAMQQATELKVCALHLIHVQPWLSKEAAETELTHRALGATARARATLDGAGLPWRLHVASGDPAEHILDHALTLGASCIVIGSRGLGTIQSLLFGSVSYKVMHLSRIPVLVVP